MDTRLKSCFDALFMQMDATKRSLQAMVEYVNAHCGMGSISLGFEGQASLHEAAQAGTEDTPAEHRERKPPEVVAAIEAPATEPAGKPATHSRRGRTVRCVETGQVFPSASAADRSVGLYNCVSNAARMGTRAGGYHWEFLDGKSEGAKPQPETRPRFTGDAGPINPNRIGPGAPVPQDPEPAFERVVKTSA